MSRLVWGDTDKRLYETGIDRGVFYPVEGMGVPWSGLVAVSEASSGADIRQGYYDGSKFVQQRSTSSFAAKVQAYSYPPEFGPYMGLTTLTAGNLGMGGQVRKRLFNFTYRTKVANDQDPNLGHLIHFVYNAVATPTARGFSSIDGGMDATLFEWDIDTIAEFLPSGEATAHVVVDTRMAHSWVIEQLEDLIYGSRDNDPRMPSITELIDMFENGSILKITDNGDGTWTAEGPDEVIKMLNGHTFEITWPSAIFIDTHTYRISSL